MGVRGSGETCFRPDTLPRLAHINMDHKLESCAGPNKTSFDAKSYRGLPSHLPENPPLVPAVPASNFIKNSTPASLPDCSSFPLLSSLFTQYYQHQ